jgi:hypothetical protein
MRDKKYFEFNSKGKVTDSYRQVEIPQELYLS